MIFTGYFKALTCASVLIALTACGTPPSGLSETEDADRDVVAAEGAASADPTYRVRGATGLLDLGIDLF